MFREGMVQSTWTVAKTIGLALYGRLQGSMYPKRKKSRLSGPSRVIGLIPRVLRTRGIRLILVMTSPSVSALLLPWQIDYVPLVSQS